MLHCSQVGVSSRKSTGGSWKRLGAGVLAVVVGGLAEAGGAIAGEEELPVSDLTAIVNLINAGFTTPPVSAEMVYIGALTSQGDFGPPVAPGGTRAAAARAAFGVNGAGIKIGVISDSFNRLGGAAANVASGDLPGPGNPNGFLTPANVLRDDFAMSLRDEGRAMLQIIHDLAPGAQLLFHSAFNNPNPSPGQSIATAISNLVAAGAHIIVDDVVLLNEPYFQDGVAAQTVNAAKAAGVAYFSSAGNADRESYEQRFRGVAGGFHNFDANMNESGDAALNINVPAGSQVRVTLEWDDPYPTVGAPVGNNPSNFNLFLVDLAANTLVSASTRNQLAGLDPWELVGVVNTGLVPKQYGLFIQHVGGPTDKLFKAIVVDSGRIGPEDDDTNSPTVVQHAAAQGGQAVAATVFSNGVTVEPFSSVGPTQILFDILGNRLAMPEIRQTPELTSTDGVMTTVPGFNPFFGTSAAAPHAAAVAALLLELANKYGLTLSVDDIYKILQGTALDMQTPGFENLSGFGLINSVAALQAIPEPSSLVLLSLGTFGLVGYGWRRRQQTT